MFPEKFLYAVQCKKDNSLIDSKVPTCVFFRDALMKVKFGVLKYAKNLLRRLPLSSVKAKAIRVR